MFCAVAAALVAPAPVAAFVQETTSEGVGLHWDVFQISYRIHEAGSVDVPGTAEFDAVHRSFRTWQDEDCLPVTFTYAGPTDDTHVGYDQTRAVGQDNLVLWRDDAATWSHSRTVIGLTSVTFDTRSGEIVDADIELNGADFDFATVSGSSGGKGFVTDVENAVTHEIGHLLGLGHSPVRAATMFARSDPGDIEKRTLANDDVDAICTVYADDGGGGGCSAASGPGGDGAFWLLLALVAVLGGRRARREGILRMGRVGRTGRVALALGLVAALVAASATDASAYVLYRTTGGTPLRWWTDEIPYVIDAAGTDGTGGAELQPEVAAGFATWEAVGCASVGFRFAGYGTSLEAAFDEAPGASNVNAVTWLGPRWDHGASVIGLTTLTFHSLTGQIVDADIEFNDLHFDFTTSGLADQTTTDVRNALTHEAGHLLGLDHSDVTDATMANRSRPGDLDKRDLHEDDIAGFCEAYRDPPPQPDPTPADVGTGPPADVGGARDAGFGDAHSAPDAGAGAGGPGSGCTAGSAVPPRPRSAGALLLLALGAAAVFGARRLRTLRPR